MSRVYTIWPADREGIAASSPDAWRQDRHWIVLDVTDGLEGAPIVEGPVSRWEALRRELEIRTTDKAIDISIRKKAVR